MARAILRGLLRQEKPVTIAARLLERFGPRSPDSLELSHAPCRGPAGAPVTLVVFSDFECPFCGIASKLIPEVERNAGPRLRTCFKHWPLRQHTRARLAAQAAVAAQRQGKFWEMHDRLFEHRTDLEREDLLTHARAVGLDVRRFEEDLGSPAVQARVLLDEQEAARLRLDGTPFFFINGRRMTDPRSVGDFLDWIAEEIALQGPPR